MQHMSLVCCIHLSCCAVDCSCGRQWISVVCMLCQAALCCAVASTLGASLVFPGARQLRAGGTNSQPPYLTGMGAVFIAWILAPLLTMCCAVPVCLWNRKTIFRSEDPFHIALWVCRPVTPLPYLAHIHCVRPSIALLYGGC